MLYLAFALVFLTLWGVFYVTLPALRHGNRFVARLIARASVRWSRVGKMNERYAAYLPVALIVIGGALFTAWAGDGFIDLAERVHAKSPRLQDFDTLAHAWAVSKRTPGATSFFTVMTMIGSPPALIGLVVAVSLLLIFTHRYRWFFYLLITTGGESLLNMELKRYFARARPAIAEMLRLAHGYSFPSGHAMGSTVVFGALSYLAFRTATSWRWKSAMLALASALVLAVALSRVYLGAHWISDVAAGVAVGALWLSITTLAYETVRRIRLLRAMRVRR
ncbi:MAG TPA: phosphatase PAP2 family protein [Thermoanaerobaculia bacterium]